LVELFLGRMSVYIKKGRNKLILNNDEENKNTNEIFIKKGNNKIIRNEITLEKKRKFEDFEKSRNLYTNSLSWKRKKTEEEMEKEKIDKINKIKEEFEKQKEIKLNKWKRKVEKIPQK
jgi:hypothetical protein